MLVAVSPQSDDCRKKKMDEHKYLANKKGRKKENNMEGEKTLFYRKSKKHTVHVYFIYYFYGLRPTVYRRSIL